MASITIRDLDDAVKAKLRIRAATHGRSMEDEARDILRTALARTAAMPNDLASAIQRRFGKVGGVEIELQPRELAREPPALADTDRPGK
jgi:plasmid stability protein